MKKTLSQPLLKEVLNFAQVKELFDSFVQLTKIDVSLVDVNGNEVISNKLDKTKSICIVAKKTPLIKACLSHTSYALFKSAEIGEPYTFKCGEMIRCIAPLLNDKKIIGGIALGPVILWDSTDFVSGELSSLKESFNLTESEVKEVINYTTKMSCEEMNHAAKLLSFIVGLLCKEDNEFYKQRNRIMMQQRQISELIQEKKELESQFNKTIKQNKDLEREFIGYAQLGDKKMALKKINEILGVLLTSSRGNLDLIKTKSLEMITELSKSASELGTESLELANIIITYTKKIIESQDFDKIFLLLQEGLEEIIDTIYEERGYSKSNENIIRAINYIRTNYSDNIKIEEVAENSYISPDYLSHLFRKELNMTYSNFLTKTRIDNAVKLIQNGETEVQNIAFQVGYNDSSYFIKVFKDKVGITPYSYIKMIEENK